MYASTDTLREIFIPAGVSEPDAQYRVPKQRLRHVQLRIGPARSRKPGRRSLNLERSRRSIPANPFSRRPLVLRLSVVRTRHPHEILSIWTLLTLRAAPVSKHNMVAREHAGLLIMVAMAPEGRSVRRALLLLLVNVFCIHQPLVTAQVYELWCQTQGSILHQWAWQAYCQQ